MPRELTRILVLNSIFGHFQMATQWPDEYSGVRYMEKAEGLIEVLEEVDCGSHGGYDRNNPNKRVTTCGLFDRFLTLLRKHDDEANIEPRCGANVETLTRYFTKLMALRGMTYSETKPKLP